MSNLELGMNQKRSFEWLKWLITLGIPAGVACVPVSDLFSFELKKFFIITIFVILLIAFEFFDSVVPAIMLPTLYFLTGTVPIEVAFGSWTSTTVWMIVGALLLTSVLESCGLLTRVAYWCIKKCGGTFTGTMYGVYITGTIISFLTFSNAYIILMTMGYGFCKALGLKLSKESALICFAAMMGGHTVTGFLYNPTFLAFGEAGLKTVQPDASIEWYTIMLYNGPMILMCLGILWILSKVFKTHKVVLKGDKDYFKKAYAELGPLSTKEKKASAVLILLMVYLFTSPMHGLDPAIGFMVIPYILFFPGVAVGDVKNVSKNINFSVIIFLASCLGIGMVGGYLGLSSVVSQVITPLLEGQSVTVTLLLMIICGIFGNLFMTPYAMMASLSSPFAQVAMDLGISPMASVMSLMISTDLVLFPYETTPYVLMYSYGLISMSDFIKLHAFKIIVTLVVFACLLVPYWSLIGLI